MRERKDRASLRIEGYNIQNPLVKTALTSLVTTGIIAEDALHRVASRPNFTIATVQTVSEIFVSPTEDPKNLPPLGSSYTLRFFTALLPGRLNTGLFGLLDSIIVQAQKSGNEQLGEQVITSYATAYSQARDILVRLAERETREQNAHELAQQFGVTAQTFEDPAALKELETSLTQTLTPTVSAHNIDSKTSLGWVTTTINQMKKYIATPAGQHETTEERTRKGFQAAYKQVSSFAALYSQLFGIPFQTRPADQESLEENFRQELDTGLKFLRDGTKSSAMKIVFLGTSDKDRFTLFDSHVENLFMAGIPFSPKTHSSRRLALGIETDTETCPIFMGDRTKVGNSTN